MNPLVIVCAGGHGAEVAGYAQSLGLRLIGMLDDTKVRGPWHGTTVLGGIADLPQVCAEHERIEYLTALGSNELRAELVGRIETLGIANLHATVLRAPRSWAGASTQIGNGTLLAPNAVVTTRSAIGAHSIVNVKASVSHDCIVGAYSNINPNATISGRAVLGEGCFVGAGAVVLGGLTIGSWAIVGAGAVVTMDIPPGVTAVGVPARIVRRRDHRQDPCPPHRV